MKTKALAFLAFLSLTVSALTFVLLFFLSPVLPSLIPRGLTEFLRDVEIASLSLAVSFFVVLLVLFVKGATEPKEAPEDGREGEL